MPHLPAPAPRRLFAAAAIAVLRAATAAGIALLVPSGAARADLAMCNASDGPLRLAIASRSEGGSWMSSGQGEIAPARCATLEYGTELQPYYWYRTDEPGFRGNGESFCWGTDPYFFVEDMAACTGEGLVAAEYRKLEVPPGTQDLVINLDGRGGTLSAPALPVIDLSRPFTPAPGPGREPGQEPAAGGGPSPEPAGGDVSHASGMAPGTHGQFFELEGVWQGCDRDRQGLFCAFHAAGWKFYAPEGAENARAYLDSLRAIPQGAAVGVRGDILREGDITADVALSEVIVRADNPFSGLFQAIQGEWVSADDDQYRMSVGGSEIVETYAGAETGERYLELRVGCPDSGGEGPAIVTTTVPGFEVQCFFFDALSDDRMVLAPEGQGGLVTFRRP